MFIEAEFPRQISAKAMGGPAFNTTVNSGFSGFEQRNQNWQTARGEWTVSLETPNPGGPSAPTLSTTQQYIDMLTSFFLNIGGKVNAFRLKDHKDFTNGTSIQTLGTGDGTTANFQLVKNYVGPKGIYQRIIFKPITSLVVDYLGNALLDTVQVSLNGTVLPKQSGYLMGGTAKYGLDHTTGIVMFGAQGATYTIAGWTSVNGSFQFNFTQTAGTPLLVNQQVYITASGSPQGTGLYNITSVNYTSATQGTFTTNNPATPSSGSGSYTSGLAQIGWTFLKITGVTVGGGSATWAYSTSSPAPVGAALATGMKIFVTGMQNAINDGGFFITGTGVGTFTTTAGSLVTESGSSGAGIADWTPASGAGAVTATFQYHMPVRFDTDNLAIQLEESNVEGGEPIVSWNQISLREVRILQGQSQG